MIIDIRPASRSDALIVDGSEWRRGPCDLETTNELTAAGTTFLMGWALNVAHAQSTRQPAPSTALQSFVVFEADPSSCTGKPRDRDRDLNPLDDIQGLDCCGTLGSQEGLTTVTLAALEAKREGHAWISPFASVRALGGNQSVRLQ